MTLRFTRPILAFFLATAGFAAVPVDDTAAADALMAQSAWDEARRAYLALHARLEKTLGPEHPKTVLALANACDASVPLAAHLNSLPLCMRVLALREKIAGPDAP